MNSKLHRFLYRLTTFALLFTSSLAFGWGGNIKGNGIVKTESREVAGFSAVTFSTPGKLTIQQTGQESLTISAEANLLPYLVSDVDNGMLLIETKGYTDIHPTQPLEFKLTVKNLTDLKLSGAGSIEADRLQGEVIDVKLSGAGSITLQAAQGKHLKLKLSGEGSLTVQGIESEQMTAKLSGVGSMNVAGNVDTLDLKLSGTGSYKGEALQTRQATVKNSGVGSVVLSVSESLDAKLSGLGSIEYIGSPRVRQKISGMGSIKQR